MKGIILTQLSEYAAVRFPDAAVVVPRDHEAMRTYPDEAFVSQVAQLARAAGVAPGGLLVDFGTHLFVRFAALYPAFVAGADATIPFLAAINGSVHDEMRRLYPDASFPRFDCARRPDGGLEMIYRSERPFADFAEGLIRGCIVYFGDEVRLRRKNLPGAPGRAARFVLTPPPLPLGCAPGAARRLVAARGVPTGHKRPCPGPAGCRPFSRRASCGTVQLMANPSVTVDEDGPLLLIGVNRPEANNLWDLDVIQAVSRAYRRLGDAAHLRVGVVYGHGRHFTAGLDLASVAPLVATGDVRAVLPADGYDPWDFFDEPCPKPIVVAAHGTCNTLGIELLLASQLGIAADDARFAQLEVARGIFPLGGGTFRLPGRLGPAGMRYLLTAERFDAATALRLGLVSEVVAAGRHLERAVELARVIAANAPLAVKAALASARAAERTARDAARSVLFERNPIIMGSSDAVEGVSAFLERRAPAFQGR